MVKVTRLTRLNVAALRELLAEDEAQRVTLTATTAEFGMTRAEALALLGKLSMRGYSRSGGVGHPVQSLHAVVRKLQQAE